MKGLSKAVFLNGTLSYNHGFVRRKFTSINGYEGMWLITAFDKLTPERDYVFLQSWKHY